VPPEATVSSSDDARKRRPGEEEGREPPCPIGMGIGSFELKPHRSESVRLSTDPIFVEKGQDIVGLYVSPPDNALVLCVNEKSRDNKNSQQ